MDNKSFYERIAKAYYGDSIDLTPRRIELIRSSIEDDSTWILRNMEDLGLDEDEAIQRGIIDSLLSDSSSARLLMKNFHLFSSFQSDLDVQKRILRKASDERYFSDSHIESILKNIKHFSVFETSSTFADTYFVNLIDENPDAFLNNLTYLGDLDTEVLGYIERRVASRYSNRWNRASLIQKFHLFKTLDADFQYRVMDDHFDVNDSYEVIRQLKYCQALLEDEERLSYLFLRSYRSDAGHTMNNFSEFKVLYNGGVASQLDLIRRLVNVNSWGMNRIVEKFDQFKALQGYDEQVKALDIFMDYETGRDNVLRYFANFTQLQDDCAIQKKILDKLISDRDNHYYLGMYFQNLKCFRGDREVQERVFHVCSKRLGFGDLIKSLDGFDVLPEKEIVKSRLTVSYLVTNGYYYNEFNDTNNPDHAKFLIDGFKESFSEGAWYNANGILKHPRVRDILAKTWKKLILDYVQVRESQGYETSERLSWKGVSLKTSEEKQDEMSREKFLLTSLKQVLSVNRIMPTEIILEMLRRYEGDPKSHEFVIKLLHNGQTGAENILEVIRGMDAFKVRIPQEDQAVIQRMANSKFKGFSEATYSYIKGLKTDKERDEQLLDWSKKSREILSGGVISEEIRQSPFYHELVFAAYRPIGFSVDGLKSLLGNQFNGSHEQRWLSHVSRWKTKVWKVMKGIGYRLRNGKAFESSLTEKVLSWIFSLKGMKPESVEFDSDRFWKIMFATAKGRSFSPKEGDVEYLVEYFLRKEGDNSIKDSVIKLFEKYPIANNTQNINFVFDFISLLEDMLQNSLPELIAHEIERLTVDSLSHQSENPWGQKIVAKLEKGFAQQIKRLKEKNSEKSIGWVHANVLADMIQKSSGLKKEIKFYSKQKKVIEPINGGYPYPLRVVMTKSLESILSRASAGLCTSDDWDKFAKADFLQMVVIDDKLGLIVGNIQLHLFEGNTKVLGRFNPSSKFLQTSVDQKRLTAELVRVVHDFADLNGLEAYIPEQTSWHQLTNRTGTDFSSELPKYNGEQKHYSVSLNSHGQNTGTIYKLKRTLD